MYREFLDDTSIFQCSSSIVRQKGESQNGGNKKTKETKFSKKINISYPLIRTHTCVYQGVRNVSYSENLEFIKNEWRTDKVFILKC